MPKKEVVAQVKVDAKDYLVYPRYFGGTITDAISIVNNSIRGKGLPLLRVHAKEGDRRKEDTDYLYVNSLHISGVGKAVVDVPQDIQDLYKEPDNEDTEAHDKRVEKIKEYFEIL